MAHAFIKSIEDVSFFLYPTDLPSIIFSESISLQPQNLKNSDSQFYPAAKGAFVLSPPHKEVSEFFDHWKSLSCMEETETNSWLNKMCKMCFTDDVERRCTSSNFISHAIMATYSIAKIMKNF
jgi:hypothetical protein